MTRAEYEGKAEELFALARLASDPATSPNGAGWLDRHGPFPHHPPVNRSPPNRETAMPSWTDVFRGRFGVYTLLLNIGILFFAVDNTGRVVFC